MKYTVKGYVFFTSKTYPLTVKQKQTADKNDIKFKKDAERAEF